jgi:hypothetical protein
VKAATALLTSIVACWQNGTNSVFELTPSVNVPAERAKLRALRDEIAADVELRKEHQRKYTARGFLRDLPALEAAGKQGNGETPIRPLRASPALGVSAAIADVGEAQAGCCGRCSREGCMGQQGVSA